MTAKKTGQKTAISTEDVHFDFDQFVREQTSEPVIMRVYGQIEELPAELPAMILLRVSDMQERGEKQTNMKDIFEMAYAVFSEQRVKAWLQKGMSINGLETMLSHAMQIYTGKMGDGKKSPSVE
jgi:hypothetical protein